MAPAAQFGEEARMNTRGLIRRTFQLSLAWVAVWAAFGAASTQATVTVGSPLTATFSTFFAGPSDTEVNLTIGEPGASVASPVNGTIVSYKLVVKTVGRFALRVMRPAGGGAYTGAGTSSVVTPSAVGTNTFSTNLPIRAGDLIGLDLIDTGSGVEEGPVTGSSVGEWGTNSHMLLADGATAPPEHVYNNGELGFNADIAASNSIGVGATRRNKKKGTATLNLTAPNPGTLTATGNGIRASSTGSAAASESVAAGPVQLLIKATGRKRKTLNATGKVKLGVALTYTPTLGEAKTQLLKVKLKKR
jgi:hypothetical protein